MSSKPGGRPGILFALGVLSVALLALPLRAQDVAAILRERADEIRRTGSVRVGERRYVQAELLAAVYGQRGYQPVWQTEGRRTQLRAALLGLADHGLEPGHYGLEVLRDAGVPSADPARSAEEDVRHTVALIRAARDLRWGRVDPATLTPRPGLALADVTQVAALMNAAATGTLFGALQQSAPAHAAYTGLALALRRLREVREAGGWPTVPPMRLAAGSEDAAVLLLRQRLRAEGDLPSEADTAGTRFDVELDAAVRSFQERHALTTDGIVGPATHRELAVPIDARIDQVRLNLERLRWTLPALPGSYVIVNVAGGTLRVVREGATVFESRVIVGRPGTRTPLFTSTIRSLDLNPTWTVPPGIVQEVLDVVRRDPSYLQRVGMRVIDDTGRPVSVSGSALSRYSARSFPYTFRQDPGPANPLGQVKFICPNSYNVYLHDTPARQLFDEVEHTFSHGCIRVQNPLQLAAALLADPKWSEASLLDAISTGRTQTLHLQVPIPVLTTYLTTAVDGRGRLHFLRDVYDRDAALLHALDRP